MSNWLLVVPMHVDEIHNVGRSRAHEVIRNDRIRSGDLAYIVAGNLGLCGWGHIIGVVRNRDDVDERPNRMRITVTQNVLQEGFGSWEQLQQDSEISGATARLEGNLVELTLKESNKLNNLFRMRGVEAPADQSDIEDNIGKFGIRDASSLSGKIKLAVGEYGTASVLFLDLDNFKRVNDDHDHSAGDKVIQETLSLVEQVVGDNGELFHRSGDEMIVLLPNLQLLQARVVAESIRQGIEGHQFSVVGKGHLTATIGLETYPQTCANWSDLEKAADRSAMQAKKSGKNRVQCSIDTENRN